MKPEDVPDELLTLYGRNYLGVTSKEAARRAMAAVIPEIERRVREQIANAILAERAERERRTPDGRPVAVPGTPTGVRIRLERRAQAERDAEIARGEGR